MTDGHAAPDGTMTFRQLYAKAGEKQRDYWWTVLAVDPLAIPVTKLLARRRWLTPDQVTLASLVLGLGTGPLYAFGSRASLVAGALAYYASFVLDCVDGKLARATGTSSPRGKALDAIADGARRTSAAVGLTAYLLFSAEGALTRDVLLAASFGILSAYFMEISGTERRDDPGDERGWRAALARRRLLPTPGMPDVSAVAYVIGPLTTLVVPALWLGLGMVVAAIGITWRRRLR